VPRRTSGFTLIEMLVVLSLLGILMGLSIGLIQKAGTGNQLILTTNALVSQLATIQAQAIGNNSAYLVIEPAGEGEDASAALRSYRNRQVFFWACEDLIKASEKDVIKVAGPITIDSGPIPSREGLHATFQAGARISLGNPPWLQMRDGFSIRCRLRIDPANSGGTMNLFQKGEGLKITLVRGDDGRFDVRCEMRLHPDERGDSGGDVELHTGRREEKDLAEWASPIIPGRWQDVQVVYDRNIFVIMVDGLNMAMRSDLKTPMRPDDEAEFVIGGGYVGGFDSLVISGIFEDDEDRFDLPSFVSWLGKDDKPVTTPLAIHYRNRSLDPRYHTRPVELKFRLERGSTERSAVRTVTIGLSGEPTIKRGAE